MIEKTRLQQLRSTAQRLKPERRHLASDLVSALTFAVVNVPQAMAHALLAMVNPVLGIYTLMVAVPERTVMVFGARKSRKPVPMFTVALYRLSVPRSSI